MIKELNLKESKNRTDDARRNRLRELCSGGSFALRSNQSAEDRAVCGGASCAWQSKTVRGVPERSRAWCVREKPCVVERKKIGGADVCTKVGDQWAERKIKCFGD